MRAQFEVNTLGPLRTVLALKPQLKRGSKVRRARSLETYVLKFMVCTACSGNVWSHGICGPVPQMRSCTYMPRLVPYGGQCAPLVTPANNHSDHVYT